MFKILVVDDDEMQRQIYEAVFSTAGFIVVSAIDGQEGLDKFKSEKPDLVFSGIIMPKFDGFTLVEKIRQINSAIPVILFSHLNRLEDRARAKKENIVFMVKGTDSPAKILEKIKELLPQNKKS